MSLTRLLYLWQKQMGEKRTKQNKSKLIHWRLYIIRYIIIIIIIQGKYYERDDADPRRLTNRSSAALWMWKTSSLKRQRQELLCRASFHKLRAVGSLFRAAWQRINPTTRKRNCTKISLREVTSAASQTQNIIRRGKNIYRETAEKGNWKGLVHDVENVTWYAVWPESQHY